MAMDFSDGQNYMDITFFPAESLITPSLTMIGSSIVTLRFLYLKSYKEPLGRLIFALNLMNLCYCSTKIFGTFFTPASEIGCRLLESFACFSSTASMILGACFGHSLYMLTVHLSVEGSSKYVTHYLTFGILGSFLLGVGSYFTPLVILKHIDGSPVCTHRIYYDAPDYTFIFFVDIPVVAALSFSIFCYSLSAKRLKSLVHTDYTYIWVLLIFPAVLVLCWLPLLIAILLVSFGVQITTSLATFLKACDQLQGFIDAIVYWQGGKKSIATICRQICCCCFMGNTSDHELEQSTLNNENARSMLITHEDPFQDKTSLEKTSLERP